MTGLLLDPQQREPLQRKLASQGFVAFGPPALEQGLLDQLRADAEAQRPAGWGQPSHATVEHRVWRSQPGEQTLALLESGEVCGLLAELIGEAVELSRSATCFTYYQGGGDHMQTHHDRPIDCSYTLILYLQVDWPGSTFADAGPGPSPGLELEVWPPGPLPDEDQAPAYRLSTRSNMAAIGRGSQTPHRRPPLAEGEQVVALTACYAPSVLRLPLESVPGDRAADPQRARQLANKGEQLWNSGNDCAAIACYRQALTLDPACDPAWSGLGFLYWYQLRFVEAREAFTRALHHNGDCASHWSNIGLCLRDEGAMDGAIRCFRTALTLDPRYAPALNEWANVLQDTGDYQQAVGLYARSLAIDASRAVVHHNLGVVYGRLGSPQRARSSFRAALRLDPDYHHSLEELALLDIKQGQVDDARALLLRASSERAQLILADLEES